MAVVAARLTVVVATFGVQPARMSNGWRWQRAHRRRDQKQGDDNTRHSHDCTSPTDRAGRKEPVRAGESMSVAGMGRLWPERWKAA
jgi:hypothetical protein